MGWLDQQFRNKSRKALRPSARGSMHSGRRLLGEQLEPRLALDGAGIASGSLTQNAAQVSLIPPSPTTLSIAQDLYVSTSKTITVPIQMHVHEVFGIQLTGVDIAFSYDSTQFTVSNVRAGSALSGFGAAAGSPTPGMIRFTASRATPVTFDFDDIGDLVLFNITPIAAPTNSTALNLRVSDGTFTTALFDQNGQQLQIDAAMTNNSDDSVDGKITVSTISRNPNTAEDVDDDTHVSGVDLVWVVSALNSPASSSPGPPGKKLYLDVNNDGSVSGFDLVTVVSKLNAGGQLQLTSNSSTAPSSGDDLSGLAFGISSFAKSSSELSTAAMSSAGLVLTPALADSALADLASDGEYENEAAVGEREYLSSGAEGESGAPSADADEANLLEYGLI